MGKNELAPIWVIFWKKVLIKDFILLLVFVVGLYFYSETVAENWCVKIWKHSKNVSCSDYNW